MTRATDLPCLMNEDPAKSSSFFDKPLHPGWKWLIVFVAALLGSGLHFIVFEHVSPEFRLNLRMLLGGAIFPFAIGMFFGIFFKGWKGVFIGVFFVLVVGLPSAGWFVTFQPLTIFPVELVNSYAW